MKLVFPYFAQLHQVFHSLPIAAELARRYLDAEVHAACATAAHVDFVREQLERHAPDAPVQVDPLLTPWLNQLPSKKRTMFCNRAYFRRFDAIVAPERTSLFFRRFGLCKAKLIWTRHGAGDRAVGFAGDVEKFDYVLMAGRKIERRLLSSGLIQPGRYTSGVYAKFDWLRVASDDERLFAQDRPVVLYNPHFDPRLSSWPKIGMQVLEYFAANPRYNLIFAPHVRLFDPPTPAKYRAFARFEGLPHMRIDLGSRRSIDMSYLRAADLYLGDVSSQVAEFVCRPRPCVFLNPRGADWRQDPNYRFWTLGPVVDRCGDLAGALDAALARPDAYAAAQARYVEETFSLEPTGSSAARGAQAIMDFLRRSSPMEIQHV